ncbi:MAG TPA: hypothetical protein VF988_16570, partial [Verrucomicrobiae bacterium]
MKFIRTVVVFDQGGLLESKQWAFMHESYLKAIQGVVHPPGNDRFLLRKKARKLTTDGNPSNQWMRNGVVPIKKQFFNILKTADWYTEKPVDMEIGSRTLHQTQEQANVVFKEYPGKRDFQLKDHDWGEIFHEKVGNFDFYSQLEGGMR